MHPLLPELFAAHFGALPLRIDELRAHGSDRKLWRFHSSDRQTAIAVENSDLRENTAFIAFSSHFKNCGLSVPTIYAAAPQDGLYLEEDLGDTTLFDLLQKTRSTTGELSPEVLALYETTVRLLPAIQITAGRTLDYSHCHPRAAFDRQSMLWDLNYFKYHFLKLAQIPFHEGRLENDFATLCDFLLEADCSFFLYRDFQSRNIMVRDGQPHFIDYQGGRRGALQYDLASLVLDAKADLPFATREHLQRVYFKAAAALTPLDERAFFRHFNGYCLIRILQAMGAYGFRGLHGRKPHFIQSIPYAIRNLEHLLSGAPLPIELPELHAVLQKIIQSENLRPKAQPPQTTTPLRIRVSSFSYKRGYPIDTSGHGGGFVFDCRALPNPGRDPRFALRTGRDQDVAAFLEAQPEVAAFITQIEATLAPSIAAYQKRGFDALSVAFGCTGGQHRSVFCAEKLASLLRARSDVIVELHHRELSPGGLFTQLTETAEKK